MTIDDLNAMDLRGFVDAVGWVFEGSPWVAERAWTGRPFTTFYALHESMTSQVADATLEEQLALLCQHPDLGARARMSDASTAEQAGAGLDSLTRAEFDRLGMLNDAYRAKFGFPFVYAVKGSAKEDILNAMERRLASTREAELGEALRQAGRIARFRLEEIVRCQECP